MCVYACVHERVCRGEQSEVCVRLCVGASKARMCVGIEGAKASMPRRARNYKRA